MASSSRARSSSPFSYRKSSTPYSSTSSSSSLVNERLLPRSCSSSASSFFNSGSGGGGGIVGRSVTLSQSRSESMYYGPCSYGGRSPVGFESEELIADPLDEPSSRDSISATKSFTVQKEICCLLQQKVSLTIATCNEPIGQSVKAWVP